MPLVYSHVPSDGGRLVYATIRPPWWPGYENGDLGLAHKVVRVYRDWIAILTGAYDLAQEFAPMGLAPDPLPMGGGLDRIPPDTATTWPVDCGGSFEYRSDQIHTVYLTFASVGQSEWVLYGGMDTANPAFSNSQWPCRISGNAAIPQREVNDELVDTAARIAFQSSQHPHHPSCPHGD